MTGGMERDTLPDAAHFRDYMEELVRELVGHHGKQHPVFLPSRIFTQNLHRDIE
jgi:hypothetical protein